MRIKEYFAQIEQIEKALGVCKAKLSHYEDLGLTITTKLSGMPGGGQRGVSKVETAAIGMADAVDALRANIELYSQKIKDAENLIAQIPQEKYRQILTLRYLCGWSMRSISDELRYNDPNSVYRAHGWALREAQNVLNRMDG